MILNWYFLSALLFVLSCNSKVSKPSIAEDPLNPQSLEQFQNLNSDEKIDFVLDKKIPIGWEVEDEQESGIFEGWESAAINRMKEDNPGYPFAALGDFDGDSTEDVAIKTHRGNRTRLYIYNPAKNTLYQWSENLKGLAMQKTRPTTNGLYDLDANSDILVVSAPETCSEFCLYWNGSEFCRQFTGL